MTKKSIVKISFILIFISFVLMTQSKELADQPFSSLIYLPVHILFYGVEKMSLSSNRWLSQLGTFILVLVIFAPLIHLYYKKPEVLKKSWLGISLGLIVILFLSMTYFSNGLLPLYNIEPYLASRLIIKVIAITWYVVLIAIYYYAYFKKLETIESIQLVLNITVSVVILALITGFSYAFFKWIVQYDNGSNSFSLNVLMKIIYDIYVVRLLLKFHSLIEKTIDEWTQTEFSVLLIKFKTSAKTFLSFSLIYALVQVMTRLATLKSTQDVGVGANVPIIEFGVVLIILFFVEILTYTVKVKQDNDGFI